jgi:hypothetical protein
MTNVIHLATVLHSPPSEPPPQASRFLAYLQQTLAAYIPQLIGLMIAPDLDGQDQAAARKSVMGMYTFLRSGRGMARTAQDGPMFAAFERALTYFTRAEEAETTDDLRAAFGLLASAMAAALAECTPALWVTADPLFNGTAWDGEGGAA